MQTRGALNSAGLVYQKLAENMADDNVHDSEFGKWFIKDCESWTDKMNRKQMHTGTVMLTERQKQVEVPNKRA